MCRLLWDPGQQDRVQGEAVRFHPVASPRRPSARSPAAAGPAGLAPTLFCGMRVILGTTASQKPRATRTPDTGLVTPSSTRLRTATASATACRCWRHSRAWQGLVFCRQLNARRLSGFWSISDGLEARSHDIKGLLERSGWRERSQRLSLA